LRRRAPRLRHGRKSACEAGHEISPFPRPMKAVSGYRWFRQPTDFLLSVGPLPKLGDFPAKGARFFKLDGDITHDRSDPVHRAVIIDKGNDRKGD
jgi:hypothetical protein